MESVEAPELELDQWVQGEPSTFAKQRGKVILVEVFQVNCPGCFIGGLPEAIGLHEKYKGRDLVVWGLATAFEDFDKNNLENLQKLLTTGEVIGDTLEHLGQQNMLHGNRLTYPIPFPVAWDQLAPSQEPTEEAIMKLIHRDLPNFSGMPEAMRNNIKKQVADFLKQKKFDARTFDGYGLKGTPSSILVDRKGVLRYRGFGYSQGLEAQVESLLDESP